MGKPVRMADIAEKLNISVESVSKALAGKSGVSREMREKVVALAKEMGYTGKKTLRRQLPGGNIGILVPDRFFSGNGFYTRLYRFLAMKSSEEGFICMMEIVSAEAERAGEMPLLIAGKRVPEDVAVCGYDDIHEPISMQSSLTTYRVDLERMAEVTVEQLLRKLRQGEPDSPACTVAGQLMIREST